MACKHLFVSTPVRGWLGLTCALREADALDVRVAPDTFAELLEDARSGDEEAWTRLYRDLAPRVLGYLYSQGCKDAEGVCGEVFCQLVRDIHRFEGDEEGFRSWVFVMAHRRLIDDARWHRRRPQASLDPEVMAEVPDGVDVEGQVVSRATAEELRGILEELTPQQRDVVLLRVFGGFSVSETAAVVGRRPGAVKLLQQRAMKKLRRRVTR